MRHEIKIEINHTDYLILRNRLSLLLSRDSHTDAHGEYRVRSLYFDDSFDSALSDKINGVQKREKFRIRFYNDNHSFIRLEKKIKINGLCDKISTEITKEEVEAILGGDIDWLYKSSDDLLKELYSKMKIYFLRPKTIVEYIREPFVYEAGGVRITLDREIKTGLSNISIFDSELPLLNTFDAFAILEIKYNEFLPDIIKNAVSLANRHATAFSKYAYCRKYD